jgi:hypothetical protein
MLFQYPVRLRWGGLLHLFLLCSGQYIGEGDFLQAAEQRMSVQFAAAQPG